MAAKLSLPVPPGQYDAGDQAQTRAAIETADQQNLKAGQVIEKLLFKDTATGHIVTVVVTSGAFVIT